MPIIERVLVANRGEIALRIMRTVRRMGLSSVAVFSDADASAPAVRFADTAVRIGPNAAKDSYLRVDAILAAAKKTGAERMHFLSSVGTTFYRTTQDKRARTSSPLGSLNSTSATNSRRERDSVRRG